MNRLKPFFANLNMFRKIIAAPAVVLFFLIILAGVSYVGLSHQQKAISDLYSIRFINYQKISQIITSFSGIHSDIYKILTWTSVGMDEVKVENISNIVNEGIGEISKNLSKIIVSDNLNDEEAEFYQIILKEFDGYASLARDTIDVSYDLGSAAVFMIMLEDKYQHLNKVLQDLWQLENDLSKESYLFSTGSLTKVWTLFFVVLSAAVILSLVITFLVAKAIVAPVIKTSEIFRDIAKGEGDLTKRLEIYTKDEIGDLSSWFNEHIANLHQLITLVSEETRNVSSYAGTMTSAVDQQVSFSMELSSSVTEISATMEEFSATAAQIASHGQTVAANAVKTLEDTREGAGCVETLTQQMKEISEDNEANIQEILDLGKRSQEITKIMEIINNIANQTKLIAFNAALEAASAGESGRRFGVVAIEIRRLADSVVESTGEIEGQISSIMDSVHRLVIASEKSSKGIRGGLEFSDKTARMLDEVVEEVEATTNAARQISQSTQQQLIATGQVVTALRNIQEGVVFSSGAVEETGAISKNLKVLSTKLETLVGKFKL